MLRLPSHPHADILSLLWKLIQVNSGPGARNPLTFPKHFGEFYPQELYRVFIGKNGSRKEVKENSHVKTNRVQNSVFLNKTAYRSNCSRGVLPVVGLSEANPFKMDFLWTGDGYILFFNLPVTFFTLMCCDNLILKGLLAQLSYRLYCLLLHCVRSFSPSSFLSSACFVCCGTH